jgi:hypothetical protein
VAVTDTSGAPQVGVQTGGPGLIPGSGYLDMYGLVGMLGTDFNKPVLMDSVVNPGQRGDEVNGPGGQRHQRLTSAYVHPITLTPEQMMDNLSVWGAENPQELLDMRSNLYARGLYGDINPKDLDPQRTAVGTADFKALGEAIKGYYTYISAKQKAGSNDALTFNQWLAPKDANGNPTFVGPAGASPQPRAPLSLTNTADLNQAGDNVSQQFLGHSQNAGQQTDFANSYHGQEQAAYDAAGVGDGPSYEQPATAADAAREYVLQNNLPEYAQHQAESFMNVFANMFLSGNSARANTSLGDAAVGVK